MARQLLHSPGKPPVHLVLAKDTVKVIKSGHPWVYADSLASLPAAPAGSLALVKTKDGDIIAKARFCDPEWSSLLPMCDLRAVTHSLQTLKMGILLGRLRLTGVAAG